MKAQYARKCNGKNIFYTCEIDHKTSGLSEQNVKQNKKSIN